jgi:hypothetical protein
MNYFEKLLYLLQGEMNTPKVFGLFHCFWIILSIIFIIILYNKKNKYGENKLKVVLGVYGIIALILEILKQLIWSFNYNQITNIIKWDYEWYSFPFQLCTTPIYVSLICLFLKKSNIRKSLLSYLAYITILGSITTIIMPTSCFVSDILVNIHTMWLHCGSLVVSVYLLISGEVEINIKNLMKAIIVFLFILLIAILLNVIIYNSGILNGETFNMFYISPYFESTLPIFNIIWKNVPYIIFLLIYISSIGLGGYLIYFISTYLKRIINFVKKQ